MQASDPKSRRAFLHLAGTAAAGAGVFPRLSLAAGLNGGHPLAPKPGHFKPRAKHLIMFFMTGGMSHVDTFDHKPRLNRDAGKSLAKKKIIKASPFGFSQHGESGRMVSDLLPQIGSSIDEFCLIHSIFNDSGGHSAATLGMHTGSITIPMPSIGSWISYGLGTFNTNLPPFVVFAAKEPYNAHQCWASNFLPGFHTGTRLIPGPTPLANLKSPIKSVRRSDLERLMLRDLNAQHAKLRPGDLQIQTRMTNIKTAHGLMQQAPAAFDLSRETNATLAMYGAKRGDQRSFAAQCLTTRRLIERGVRVVELFDVGSNSNWDSHGNILDHRRLTRTIDRPIAGLVKDLKQRGLLDDTLIVGCTEFGRTPWQDQNPKGRGHHAAVFTCFFAGGGTRRGFSYGASDDLGATVASNPVHIHDFHATILHLMGLDHTQLTYRYSGRDFRLTDIRGEVIKEVIG
jgi:hypothetical protein